MINPAAQDLAAKIEIARLGREKFELENAELKLQLACLKPKAKSCQAISQFPKKSKMSGANMESSASEKQYETKH